MRKRSARLLPVLVLTLGGATVLAQVHDPRALEADPASATEQIAPVLEGIGGWEKLTCWAVHNYRCLPSHPQ